MRWSLPENLVILGLVKMKPDIRREFLKQSSLLDHYVSYSLFTLRTKCFRHEMENC